MYIYLYILYKLTVIHAYNATIINNIKYNYVLTIKIGFIYHEYYYYYIGDLVLDSKTHLTFTNHIKIILYWHVYLPTIYFALLQCIYVAFPQQIHINCVTKNKNKNNVVTWSKCYDLSTNCLFMYINVYKPF